MNTTIASPRRDTGLLAYVKNFLLALVVSYSLNEDVKKRMILGEGKQKTLKRRWRNFYKNKLGIDVDFSSLQIPSHNPIEDILILVPSKVNVHLLVSAYCSLKNVAFPPPESSAFLINRCVKNDRDNTRPYGIVLKKSVTQEERMFFKPFLSSGGLTLTEMLLTKFSYPGFRKIPGWFKNWKLSQGTRESGNSAKITFGYSNRKAQLDIVSAPPESGKYDVCYIIKF